MAKRNSNPQKPADQLTAREAKAEHARLEAEISAHDKRYYQQDAPTVSDAEYDELRPLAIHPAAGFRPGHAWPLDRGAHGTPGPRRTHGPRRLAAPRLAEIENRKSAGRPASRARCFRLAPQDPRWAYCSGASLTCGAWRLPTVTGATEPQRRLQLWRQIRNVAFPDAQRARQDPTAWAASDRVRYARPLRPPPPVPRQ